MLLNKLKTSSVPWFGLAVFLFVLGLVLGGGVGVIVGIVSFFVGLGACIRAVALAVRDDDVSSASIMCSPVERTMATIGADSAAARRRRRDARARRQDSSI
jgi:hypothetical protein